MPESDWANKRRKGGAGAGVLSKGMEAQAVWGGGRYLKKKNFPVDNQNESLLF